jgi:hypothetical protein
MMPAQRNGVAKQQLKKKTVKSEKGQQEKIEKKTNQKSYLKQTKTKQKTPCKKTCFFVSNSNSCPVKMSKKPM